MFNLFTSFVRDYGSKFRLRIIFVLLSAIIAASFEVIGVALLYPLITISMNPALVEQSDKIRFVYELLGFNDTTFFLVFIAFCVGMSFIVKNIYMLIQQRFQFNLVRDWRNDICSNLMESYIGAPLTFHLTKDSSTIINNLTAVVSRAVNSYLIQCIMLVSNMIVCFALLAILLYQYSGISVLIGGVVGGLIFIQMKVIRRVTRKLNDEYVQASQENIGILTMALAGVKDTKLIGKESIFLGKYNVSNRKVSDLDKTNMFVQYIPIYLTEAILMFGIVMFISYVLLTSANPAEGIASITLLAAVAIRLAPMMNRVLYCYSQIKSSSNAVETIQNEFEQLKGQTDIANNRLEFNDSITFRDVNFSYDGKNGKGLKAINAVINKGDFIGVVGSSGAGKTTFADVLSGLLTITSGNVLLDGKEVSLTDYKNIRNNVSYVSQSPFILNTSIRENVAFGIPKADINDAEVLDAIEKSGLNEIVAELGLDYELGENGKKLSGGQRQRVIIARALYFNREIIVLDEATSALDATTENDISNAILALKGKRTIIVIAHRLSTLKNADKLFVFSEGSISAVGGFDNLSNENDEFRKMVELSRY
ncbi:ABC transporter ATP-binding protein [Photobacterium kasasachensis]|uniref:ABC transporter ATP-binding protein n=1 Tax=Photobacterium kasasachensis TaxID=2910240 RepID=UPI003D09DA4B